MVADMSTGYSQVLQQLAQVYSQLQATDSEVAAARALADQQRAAADQAQQILFSCQVEDGNATAEFAGQVRCI